MTLGVALLLPAGVEAADDAPTDEQQAQAREHFEDGAEYFFEQRYGRALVEFRRAYRLNPHPLILYNKSLANLHLGNVDDAYDNIVELDEMGGLPEAESLRNDARLAALDTALQARELSDKIEIDTGDDNDDDDDDGDDAIAVSPPPESTDESTLGAMGWSGVALTGIGAGLLTYAGVVNYRLGSKIESYEQAAANNQGDDYDALRTDIERSTTTGQIALYSGAGLAVTGMTLWAIDALSGSSTPDSTAGLPLDVAITGSPETGGLVHLRGNF